MTVYSLFEKALLRSNVSLHWSIDRCYSGDLYLRNGSLKEGVGWWDGGGRAKWLLRAASLLMCPAIFLRQGSDDNDRRLLVCDVAVAHVRAARAALKHGPYWSR
jgi:hypothetical protein